MKITKVGQGNKRATGWSWKKKPRVSDEEFQRQLKLREEMKKH